MEHPNSVYATSTKFNGESWPVASTVYYEFPKRKSGLKFPKKKFMDKGAITLGFQKINESRIKRKFESLNRSHQIEDLTVLSLNGDFDKSFINGHTISYGMETTYNKNYSEAYDRVLKVNGNKVVGMGEKNAIPTRYPSDGSSYTSFAS